MHLICIYVFIFIIVSLNVQVLSQLSHGVLEYSDFYNSYINLEKNCNSKGVKNVDTTGHEKIIMWWHTSLQVVVSRKYF